MSLSGSSSTVAARAAEASASRRLRAAATGLRAYGEPLLWLTSGGLAIALAMISGLLALVLVQGAGTFWPLPLVRIETADGNVAMGEVTRTESWRPDDEALERLPAGERDRARAILATREAERRLGVDEHVVPQPPVACSGPATSR